MRTHAAPVFAPARTQEKTLANYLCIGFVPGGTIGPKFVNYITCNVIVYINNGL